jgi:hypothetical protein
MKTEMLADGVRVTLKVPFVLPWMKSPFSITDRKRTLREADAASSLAGGDRAKEGKPCKR